MRLGGWRQRRRHLRAVLGLRRARRVRIRPGTLPGTLAPVEAAPPPRLSVIAFSRTDVREAEVGSIDEALARPIPGGVTWLNLDGLGDAHVLARLGERFELHPLTLEDALNVGQRPKVERYDKYFFMVTRTVRLVPPAADPEEAAGEEIREEQVSIFFGADWVLTVQERSDGDCFNTVREAIRQGRGRVRDAGADYLAYLLLDAVVDAYFPVVEALAERIHALEQEALEGRSERTLLEIQHLRTELLALRRAIWPMREEMAILQREESPLIAAETRIFLRDVYDHAIQALEIVESLRETAVSLMELYLSAQNQRLNSVMKVLTVIATIFIPLTFIASIYGMNFEHMPELRWRYGYAYALALMALTAGLMVAFFKKRGWW